MNVIDQDSIQPQSESQTQVFQSDLPLPIIYDPKSAAEFKQQQQASLIGVAVIVILVLVLGGLWVAFMKRPRKAVQAWYLRFKEKVQSMTNRGNTTTLVNSSVAPSEASSTPASSKVDLSTKERDLEGGTTLPALPSQPITIQAPAMSTGDINTKPAEAQAGDISGAHHKTQDSGVEPRDYTEKAEEQALGALATEDGRCLPVPAPALAIPRDESLRKSWISWRESFRTFGP